MLHGHANSVPVFSLKVYVLEAGFLAIHFSKWPVNISHSMRKSEMNDQNGYPKVAGLFFSSRKCPVHANPYAMGSHKKAHHG